MSVTLEGAVATVQRSPHHKGLARNFRGRDARPSASLTSSCVTWRDDFCCCCFYLLRCIQTGMMPRCGTWGGRARCKCYSWKNIFLFYFFVLIFKGYNQLTSPQKKLHKRVSMGFKILSTSKGKVVMCGCSLLEACVGCFFTLYPVTFSSLFLPTRKSLITI